MDSLVKEAIELRAESVSINSENRANAREDISFELGGENAWDEKIWRARGKRPKVTVDSISVRKYRLANDLRDLNPEIQFIPKDSKWDDHAEVMDYICRDIQDRSGAESIYDNVFVQGLTGGFSYFEVCVQHVHEQTFDQNIILKNIPNCFAVHTDPYMLSPSYLDMKWAQKEYIISKGLYLNTYGEKSAATYPSDAFESKGDDIVLCKYYKVEEKPKTLVMISNGTKIAEGYSDDKLLREALNAEINGVRLWKEIATRKTTESKIKVYNINGSEIIDETDHLGKYIPIIPYEARTVYRDGKKYIMSFVRPLKEPARMKNYMRSLQIELVALQPLNQWVGATKAIGKHLESYQNAHARRNGVLLFDHVDEKGNPLPEPKQQFWNGPSGITDMSQSWDQELNLVSGMNAGEYLGGPSQLRSGVAIDLKQDQGNHNVFDFVDRFVTCSLNYLGHVLNDLIPKVHNSEEIITLTKNGKQVQRLINGVDKDGKEINLSEAQFDVKPVVGSANESKKRQTYEKLTQLATIFPDNMRDALPVMAKNIDGIKDKEELIRIFKAQQSPAVANAEGLDEEKALAENGMLKQQMQDLQAQLDQANQLISSMQIDYQKAIDVQTIRGETELEKVRIQSETTLLKTEMDNQAKVLAQLADGISIMTQKLEGLTAQAEGGKLTIEGKS